MNLDREIHKRFHLSKLPPSSDTIDGSLSYLGYPSLFSTSFFLSLSTAEHWLRHRLLVFPSLCCVCGGAGGIHTVSYCKHRHFLRSLKSRECQQQIPYCKDHNNTGPAELIVSVNRLTGAAIKASLVGLDHFFLKETKALNQQGDPVPPWLAFPDYNPPSGGWRQGDGEEWMHQVWQPFWRMLPPYERSRYLSEHRCPIQWEKWLRAVY